MDPIPVVGLLVPAPVPAIPPELTRADVTIGGSLPFTVALDATWRLVVVGPTGLGTTWRDAAADEVILDGTEDVTPVAPTDDRALLARVPARIIVRTDRAVAGSVPLARGIRRICGDVELLVVDYRLVAGSMSIATPGSSLTLAWRRVTAGSATFAEPPVHPLVEARLPAQYRFGSTPRGLVAYRRWRLRRRFYADED